MGFFSKVFKKIKKGVKSAFKSIGKGIKSAFKNIGKFMGKIGIVGQLALMFTPVGAMMGKVFSGIGGAVAKGIGKLATSANPLLKGAGKVLEAGAKFAKAGHSAFRTVTDGVTTFVKEFTGAALNKVGITTNVGSKTFSQAWNATQEAVQTRANEVITAFDKRIGGMTTAAEEAVMSEYKGKALTGETTDVVDVSKSLLAEPQQIDASGFNKTAFYKDLDTFDMSTLGERQQFVDTGFNKIEFDKSISEGAKRVSEQLGTTTSKPTLVDRLMTGIKEAPQKFGEAAVKKVEEYPTTLVEGVTNRVTGAIETRAVQALDLEEKPQAPVYYQAYVPQFTTAPAGTYGSPEINDRAMQVELSGGSFYNQAPFGAGANFYVQQMSRSIGGTV